VVGLLNVAVQPFSRSKLLDGVSDSERFSNQTSLSPGPSLALILPILSRDLGDRRSISQAVFSLQAKNSFSIVSAIKCHGFAYIS
jgi:hypothetical protein